MQKDLAMLTPGEEIFGFRLEKIQQISANDTCLYTLRHIKTGAELLYSCRESENKTFYIAFETLPENHTGVFHILEHSVLCGSKKYPVKEPFVVLLQSSMQTFLNAMTYSDKTVYPVCSRNEQDFRNLMNVYLDAVFDPAIYEKPEIFMQEGWHYELENTQQTPSYNGVVFSEMKGAFSDVDDLISEETMSTLFPDSCYRFCSGGHPAHIPELTYEEFIRTHRRFYHPSNAKLFLDGTMEIAPILQYIDETYLSRYDYRAPDFAMVHQTPVVSSKRISYQEDPQQKGMSHMVLAKILSDYDEIEKNYAAQILCDYLTGSNEAPLQRAILEAGLGQDTLTGFADGLYQNYISFKVRNTKPEHFDAICKTLRDTVAQQLAQGLDKESLSASLERYAFRCREIEEPYGLVLGLRSLDTWLYGGEPTAHWETEKIFAALREKLSTDYFEKLLFEAFGEPERMCRLEFVPSETLAQEQGQQEQAKLQAAFDSWTEEEKEATLVGYQKLQSWQQSPDTPEALAMLPKLNLKDIPLTVSHTQVEQSQLCGKTLWQVQEQTHGIVYLNLFFRLGDFSPEQLQKANFLTSVLSELSTQRYSALSLQSQIKTWLGSLDARIEIVSQDGQPDTCTPYMLVSASTLEENTEKAMALLEEILCHTVFTEKDRVGEMLKQSDYALRQALIGSGHSFAITKVLSPFTASATVHEALSGETAVRWVSQLAKDFESQADDIMQELAQLAQQIFCKSRLSVGVGGNLPQAHLERFLNALPEGEPQADVVYSNAGEKDVRIDIPSGVNFCGMGHNLYAMGYEFTGSAVVLGTMMSFGYLWNAVRVQGGAYGTGMAVRATGDMFCYSYRDPNPKATFEAFRAMTDFLEQALQGDMPLDDTIIGTVGRTSPLMAPGAKCKLACLRKLKGVTHESLDKTRKEILTTTAQDLKKLLPAVRTFLSEGAMCVVGGTK